MSEPQSTFESSRKLWQRRLYLLNTRSHNRTGGPKRLVWFAFGLHNVSLRCS